MCCVHNLTNGTRIVKKQKNYAQNKSTLTTIHYEYDINLDTT